MCRTQQIVHKAVSTVPKLPGQLILLMVIVLVNLTWEVFAVTVSLHGKSAFVAKQKVEWWLE